jgi:hypothetical protein
MDRQTIVLIVPDAIVLIRTVISDLLSAELKSKHLTKVITP